MIRAIETSRLPVDAPSQRSTTAVWWTFYNTRDLFAGAELLSI